ncbi:MAG: SHOCT domain-containing protein [Phycisphaerae bacterium]|nr:SHOCT domain-containing protein [Phycisphaerae bacterium]
MSTWEPSTIGALTPAAKVVISSCVLIVFLLIGGAVVLYLRGKFYAARNRRAAPGLSMETLQQLRQSGEISEQEFARLRRSSLGISEPTGERANSTSSRPPADDDENHASKNG